MLKITNNRSFSGESRGKLYAEGPTEVEKCWIFFYSVGVKLTSHLVALVPDGRVALFGGGDRIFLGKLLSRTEWIIVLKMSETDLFGAVHCKILINIIN
jgi:hypothetical protein